jgi:hypothetical protein
MRQASWKWQLNCPRSHWLKTNFSDPDEGIGKINYRFSRTGDTSTELTVSFSVGGTATFSGDYTQSGADTFGSTIGTITFWVGSSTATLDITPISDTVLEPDETVILTLAEEVVTSQVRPRLCQERLGTMIAKCRSPYFRLL